MLLYINIHRKKKQFVVQLFFSLVLFSDEIRKSRGTKLNGKKLNDDRQIFKYIICIFFDGTLCNLIAGVTVSIFRKKCYQFSLFPFINTTSQRKIFIYSTYPFLLQPLPCASTHLLINHTFSWKSKLKLQAFFSRCKIFSNKT